MNEAALSEANQALEEIPSLLDSLLTGGDALVLIPPFFQLESMSLGAYNLLANATQAGYKVEVLQVDQLLARVLGISVYQALANRPTHAEEGFLASHLFVRRARGASARPPVPGFSRSAASANEGYATMTADGQSTHDFTSDEFDALEAICLFVRRARGASARPPVPGF
ncbi:MAG: hypothetical protein AAFQ98_05350, partial [Bacteroidota bacterium]